MAAAVRPRAGATCLAVWGAPISHSRSPQLHSSAYERLGYGWEYGRHLVTEADFARELADLGRDARGLSLTYPLKTVAYQAALTHDRAAALSGAVNTLLLTDDGPHGFNTDISGIAEDLREHGVREISHGRIVGGGATATSALIALGELGATRVEVVARRPEAAAALAAVGAQAGIDVSVVPMTPEGVAALSSAPVTISTLPGGVELSPDVSSSLADVGGLLYDVVYGHWPTTLAASWERAGAQAVNGLGMLLHQAVRQIRIFSTGDPHQALPDEAAVVGVMRLALMGD